MSHTNGYMINICDSMYSDGHSSGTNCSQGRAKFTTFEEGKYLKEDSANFSIATCHCRSPSLASSMASRVSSLSNRGGGLLIVYLLVHGTNLWFLGMHSVILLGYMDDPYYKSTIVDHDKMCTIYIVPSFDIVIIIIISSSR